MRVTSDASHQGCACPSLACPVPGASTISGHGSLWHHHSAREELMRRFSLATIERSTLGQQHDRPREIAALVVDTRLFPLDELAPHQPGLQAGLFELLHRWDDVYPAVQALAERVDPGTGGLSPDDRSIRIVTPIRHPRAVFCTVF